MNVTNTTGKLKASAGIGNVHEGENVAPPEPFETSPPSTLIDGASRQDSSPPPGRSAKIHFMPPQAVPSKGATESVDAHNKDAAEELGLRPGEDAHTLITAVMTDRGLLWPPTKPVAKSGEQEDVERLETLVNDRAKALPQARSQFSRVLHLQLRTPKEIARDNALIAAGPLRGENEQASRTLTRPKWCNKIRDMDSAITYVAQTLTVHGLSWTRDFMSVAEDIRCLRCSDPDAQTQRLQRQLTETKATSAVRKIVASLLELPALNPPDSQVTASKRPSAGPSKRPTKLQRRMAPAAPGQAHSASPNEAHTALMESFRREGIYEEADLELVQKFFSHLESQRKSWHDVRPGLDVATIDKADEAVQRCVQENNLPALPGAVFNVLGVVLPSWVDAILKDAADAQ